MAAVYAGLSGIASETGQHDQMLIIGALADQPSQMNRSLGHHALGVLGPAPWESVTILTSAANFCKILCALRLLTLRE
jgi:hypothetical protein